jgi:hypothetical protein
VPVGLSGQLTAKVHYDTKPFEITCKETEFTVE